jgi:hypothetical protein
LTSEEEQDLEEAMNILAPEVANEVFNSKRQVLRRRLEVSVELPTSIFGTTPAPAGMFLCNVNVCICMYIPKLMCLFCVFLADCPNDGDTCLDVSASVTLLLDGQNVTESQTKYTKALTQAIDDGRLETALLEVNNETSVKVLGSAEATSPTTPTPAPESSESSEGLSSGATAGIAIAAVATVLAAAGLLVARKRTQEKTDAYYAAGTQALADSDQVARDAADMKESDVVMLGATQADYGKKSKQAAQTSVVAFDTLEVEDEKGMRKPGSGDSSSNAGSSGWSSSAGVSSLNTGSADSLDFAGGAAVGATLAAIGKASAIPRQTQEEEYVYQCVYCRWKGHCISLVSVCLLLLFLGVRVVRYRRCQLSLAVTLMRPLRLVTGLPWAPLLPCWPPLPTLPIHVRTLRVVDEPAAPVAALPSPPLTLHVLPSSIIWLMLATGRASFLPLPSLKQEMKAPRAVVGHQSRALLPNRDRLEEARAPHLLATRRV